MTPKTTQQAARKKTEFKPVQRRLLIPLTIVLLLLVAPAITAQAKQPQESGHIIVGTESEYPPYSQLGENDEPVGFNVEVTRALARVTGLDVEIDYRPWGEIRDDLENGSIDAICGMYYSAERDRLVDFSQPFTIVHHAAFARKGAEDLESSQQLRGKKLIVMRGDIMHDLVLEEGYCDSPILTDTQAGALKALASGRGDYALVAKLPGITLGEGTGTGCWPGRPCSAAFPVLLRGQGRQSDAPRASPGRTGPANPKRPPQGDIR